MKKHLQYLWYLARHKWFVFVAGLKVGAPLWRLIIHDWSKFTPAEWQPYVDTFYGTCKAGDRKRLNMCSFCASRQGRFDRAWLHHQHLNPHHWQHWVLRNDDGSTKPLMIPYKFVLEMVADWMGAGRAITGKWDVAAWYALNREKILLHSLSRVQVDQLIRMYGKAT